MPGLRVRDPKVNAVSAVVASLFDYKPGDLALAECEPKVQIDLSSGKVPFQVVSDIVSVVAEFGCSCHLDRVGELTRRPGQPRSDLVRPVVRPAFVSHAGIVRVALDC